MCAPSLIAYGLALEVRKITDKLSRLRNKRVLIASPTWEL